MFWSRNSCICEIRKVYCSSTLSDKYFSRNTLRFVLPNLERQRLPHHDLLVSIAIWRSEVKKLNLFNTHLSRISFENERFSYASLITRCINLVTFCTPCAVLETTGVDKLDREKWVWSMHNIIRWMMMFAVSYTQMVVFINWA